MSRMFSKTSSTRVSQITSTFIAANQFAGFCSGEGPISFIGFTYLNVPVGCNFFDASVCIGNGDELTCNIILTSVSGDCNGEQITFIANGTCEDGEFIPTFYLRM